MPELPEVEVTRRQLLPAVVGRTIEAVQTTPDSYFFVTKPHLLRRRLAGRRVCALDRLGKYLVMRLDGGPPGEGLLLHLGMTGQLFVDGAASVRLLRTTAAGSATPEQQRQGARVDKHVHMRFRFDRGADLLFRDPRKFGKVEWLASGQPCARLDKLGVDALEVTGEQLFAATRGRRASIKTALLDQSLLAGVGNIYADEGLFLAGIRPRTAAGRVSRARTERLVGAVQQVMRRSIETGGSSISDYVHADGTRGSYQDERRVYARTGEPCGACGTTIRRIVVGQRGTHYCPSCQK